MRARFLAVRLVTMLSIAAVFTAASAASSPVFAQGKKGGSAGAAKVPPGQAKKAVTTGEAVELSRNLLTKHGFTIVRIETVKGAQVIYYRAGNQGRGRGQGPVKSMIVRPSGSIVTFEAVPEKVRLDIKLQLGF
jgi:hypothetical protein